MLKLNTVLTAACFVLMAVLGFIGKAIYEDVATIKAATVATTTQVQAITLRVDDHETHTSGAAFAYAAVVTANHLGAIWFPAHKEQFDATAEVLKSAALGYGLLMAGDAKPQLENPKPNP
jgi:hypothetical protein